MPSQPTETPDQDLAHVIQYAHLAALAVCDARRSAGKRNIILTIQEENELLDYLNSIEQRARAARDKLLGLGLYPTLEQLAAGVPGSASPPMEYLAGGMPNKLLRYYDCVKCSKPHWEDERPRYDEHVGYASKQGFRFGHRTELGLVR